MRQSHNLSTGNIQTAMQSGFKTDLNSSYASGASSFQHMDGAQERVQNDGTMLMQSGMGLTTSGGAVKVNFRENAGLQIASAASINQSLLESDQRSYLDAERDTFSNASNYIATLAKHEANGKTVDYSKMGEYGQAVQQAVSYTKGVAAQNNYNWEQAASTTLSLSASGKLFGVVGGGVDISASVKNFNVQQATDETRSGSDNSHLVKYDDIVRGSSSEQFATSNNIDKSYSDDVRRSYEKQKSLESSISVRSEKAKQYSESLSRIESSDMSMDRENYQQLQDNISRQYDVSGQTAHKWIESGDSRATVVYRGMVGQFLSGPGAESMQHARQEVSNEVVEDRFKAFDKKHDGNMNRNPSAEIKQHASSQGFDASNPEEFTQNNIKDKVKALSTANSDQLKGVKHGIDTMHQKATQEVKRYEKRKTPFLGK